MKRALLCLLLLGCTKTKTTPPGPLGDVDFTDKLPKGMTAPPESAQKVYEATQKTCKDAQGKEIELHVKWWVFEQGPSAHITKAHVDLVHADDGFEVKMGTMSQVGGESLTPGAPWRDLGSVHVKCLRQTFRYSYDGGGFVSFDVNGKLRD